MKTPDFAARVVLIESASVTGLAGPNTDAKKPTLCRIIVRDAGRRGIRGNFAEDLAVADAVTTHQEADTRGCSKAIR
ncbi:hypothetical protein [Rosistilla carotiformis]|uniref:hypothetical protein n=1 Tax=Rosistilla carotiformis TaxID=2528017 RepID=UPI0018D22666|nr:hypothetical protein [Rosistilla carotiformis]